MAQPSSAWVVGRGIPLVGSRGQAALVGGGSFAVRLDLDSLDEERTHALTATLVAAEE